MAEKPLQLLSQVHPSAARRQAKASLSLPSLQEGRRAGTGLASPSQKALLSVPRASGAKQLQKALCSTWSSLSRKGLGTPYHHAPTSSLGLQDSKESQHEG